VEWRARRIADPVARLHYLRHTVGDRTWWPEAEEGRSRVWMRRNRRALAWSLAALVLLPAGHWGARWTRLTGRAPVMAAEPAAEPRLSPVWLVEQQREFEWWSNGLRVERRYEVENEPRRYLAYLVGEEALEMGGTRSAPAGIVYHTTESQQTEFQEGNAGRLKYIGESLLAYVRQNRSYHYVIDRFGRVWRVVRETDAANHAGYSLWADGERAYLNLNRSFLGVSVEAQSRPEDGEAVATPAQVHALRLLTEMLRAKYEIGAANCVTHAQVSVNPSNFRIAYHTDWAAHFPYAEIGLPGNYEQPHPALALFGFSYDPALVESAGAPFRRGLLLGEDRLRQTATAQGLPAGQWRRDRQHHYRAMLKQLQARNEKTAQDAADHTSDE